MIQSQQFLDLCCELCSIDLWNRMWSDLLRHRCSEIRDEKTEAGAREQIVHHRVELVTLQPAPRISPDLADDIGVWIALFDPVSKLLPEGIVVDLVGHI